MEKYLFTDGTNVVREVQSGEELQNLISGSSDPLKIRIWVFNTNEWVPYSEFTKRFAPSKKTVVPKTDTPMPQKAVPVARPKKRYGTVLRFTLVPLLVAAVFLVYNSTRIKWHRVAALEIQAARPANVPIINMDSLVTMIEFTRRQKLDKITSTNLRIRNSWPDRIVVKLQADRDSSQHEIKFHNLGLAIDNSTGYQVDQAIVEIKCWKNYEAVQTDTVQFNNISYSTQSKRTITKEYRGDSLSINFLSLRAKAFNFCYEAGKESNYGNLNDRWFCKD